MWSSERDYTTKNGVRGRLAVNAGSYFRANFALSDSVPLTVQQQNGQAAH